MSTRESWQLIMRKYFRSIYRRFTHITPGIMREQETRRTLRSCIRTSTAACFVANVVPSLTSLTRTTTLKLANEESDETLPR